MFMLQNPTRAFLCTLLWSAFPMAVSAAIPFETVEKGTSSGYEDELRAVYRTPDEFAALWHTHASKVLPTPDVPSVDFESEMVAAVFLGQKITGGYGVEVTSVDRNDAGAVTVNYETSSPPPGAMTITALTEPFHMIRLEKSAGEVVFEGTVKPPDAPPAAPTSFMVGIEKGVSKEDVKSLIDAHPSRGTIKELGSFLTVGFESGEISKEDFVKFLENLEGVKYVEEDVQF